MLSEFDYLILLSSIVVLMAGSFYARLHKHSELADYISVGRKLTMPMFVATLVSSWYGMIFGVTQIAFENGIYNFVTQGFFWYLSAGLFGLFVVDKIKEHNFHTIPELIKMKYGKSPGLIAAGLFIFKTLPFHYALGFGAFINYFFGIDLNLAILLCIIVIGVYCFFGGLKGTIITDIGQFVLMFGAVFCVLVFSYKNFGGLSYLQEKLPPSYFSVQGNQSIFAVLSWFLIAISTTFLSPIFYSRTMIAKTKGIAKRGILISIVFWFFCDIATTLGGMYAKAYMPDAASYNAYLNYSLAILPEGLRALFILGVLATAYSALDTHFFIPVSILVNDLLGFCKSTRQKKLLAIAIAGGLTYLLAVSSNYYIERSMLIVEGIFVGTMLIPVLLAYFYKGLSLKIFYCMFVGALGAQGLAFFAGVEDFFLFGILGGLIGLAVGLLRRL
jgi:SSS family solute:Na+ symporter